MREIKYKKIFVLIGCVSLQLVIIFLPNMNALAEMSSASFKIPTDVVSIGGGRGTSSSFIVEDTVGEAATGEDIGASGTPSPNYRLCAGFQCMGISSFLSFSVKEGLSSPGTDGAGVALGGLTPGSVKTSDGSSINSIFLTGASQAASTVIQVKSLNAALKSATNPTATLPSATADLSTAARGYGLCIFSATNLTKTFPYNDADCDRSTLHKVGIVDTSRRTVLSSTGAFQDGDAEVLVKAKSSTTTAAATDYADTLTFTMTSTY